MMKRNLKQLTAAMCAVACVATTAPVMNVSATTYTAEQLYDNNFTTEEFTDFANKYGDINKYKKAQSSFGYVYSVRVGTDSESAFGKIPTDLKDIAVSVENDRTGGINIRYTNCRYSVAIERYDYSTKKWELLDYKSSDETRVDKLTYKVDLAAGDEYSTTRDVYDFDLKYYLYEDNTTQVNKNYKYRIAPFNIFSQSRAEAVALGKEAEYDKIVSEYQAKGCKVVEENGYSVVFYPSYTTKKVKNTLAAPYVSVKETKYCSKCKTYSTAYFGDDMCSWHNKKYKHQITLDIEWQDVDGYEIYRSSYSDTGFKKWKTIKPKAITHSDPAYPGRTNGQHASLSTTFLYHTKLSDGKYFYKVRSYVVVNGKKVYSKFSPVASTYNYVIHEYMSMTEEMSDCIGERLADTQATKEYNRQNRIWNQNAYAWEKYLAGKLSKTKLMGEVTSKMYRSETYDIYKKTVKSVNAKNAQQIGNDIKSEIQKKNPKMWNLSLLSVNVAYKKSKKVYEISVVYKGTVKNVRVPF